MIVNDRKFNRIVAFALVIMLVFIVAFSEYFIHREANHDCHDEECLKTKGGFYNGIF